MEQHQQKAALVLKYAKRRFDGGNEAELIRVIERQQDIDQLNKLFQHPESANGMSFGFTAPLNAAATAPEVQQQDAQQKAHRTRYSKLGDILVRGPLQICIGLVGILTAGLAIVTFRRQGNTLMLQQSQLVFGECVKSLHKGCWDTLTSPVKVLKAVFTKA
jgi:hypothetical protein